MAEADNSGSLKLLIAFVGGGAFIAATAIALQGMYLNFEWNTDVQRSLAPNVELQQARDGWNDELTNYRLNPGEVKDPKVTPPPALGIPLSRAMELVIAENGAKSSEPKAAEKDAKAGQKDVKEHQK
jgi:hypothetical protein